MWVNEKYITVVIYHYTLLLMWGKIRNTIIADACKKLKLVLGDVCETHGYEHALTVLNHTTKALEVHNSYISEQDWILIELAGLCHDADDYKYWPLDSKNTENVLEYCSDGNITTEEMHTVLQMINWVGCSKNGNTIPKEAISRPELLYPRYADRLEAIGEIGVERCYIYTKKKGINYFVESTPKAQTEEEVWKYATRERFLNYAGTSASMIDHYYDKLLHISKFDVDNTYLKECANNKLQILIDICVHYGKYGELHPIFKEFDLKMKIK